MYDILLPTIFHRNTQLSLNLKGEQKDLYGQEKNGSITKWQTQVKKITNTTTSNKLLNLETVSCCAY